MRSAGKRIIFASPRSPSLSVSSAAVFLRALIRVGQAIGMRLRAVFSAQYERLTVCEKNRGKRSFLPIFSVSLIRTWRLFWESSRVGQATVSRLLAVFSAQRGCLTRAVPTVVLGCPQGMQ